MKSSKLGLVGDSIWQGIRAVWSLTSVSCLSFGFSCSFAMVILLGRRLRHSATRQADCWGIHLSPTSILLPHTSVTGATLRELVRHRPDGFKASYSFHFPLKVDLLGEFSGHRCSYQTSCVIDWGLILHISAIAKRTISVLFPSLIL